MRFKKPLCLLLLFCLAMCLFPSATARDVEHTGIYARVANPNPKDKLFLRPGPSKEGKPLGLYYNGTQVELLSEADPTWRKVRIGSLTGYMMGEYLATGEAAQAVLDMHPIVHVRVAAEPARATLWADRSTKSAVLGSYPNGTGVTVLGVDTEWLHVQIGDQIGFMQAKSLSSVDEAAEIALMTQLERREKRPWPGGLPAQGEQLLYETKITVHESIAPMMLTLWGMADAYGQMQCDGIRIWRDGELLQALPAGIDAGTWRDRAADFVEVIDVNFDGYLDVMVCQSAGANNHFYRYWTWDPIQGAFYENKAFNKLRAYPEFDAEAGRIACSEKDGAAYRQEFAYVVENGLPILVERRDYAFESGDRCTVTHWQLRDGELVKVKTTRE